MSVTEFCRPVTSTPLSNRRPVFSVAPQVAQHYNARFKKIRFGTTPEINNLDLVRWLLPCFQEGSQRRQPLGLRFVRSVNARFKKFRFGTTPEINNFDVVRRLLPCFQEGSQRRQPLGLRFVRGVNARFKKFWFGTTPEIMFGHLHVFRSSAQDATPRVAQNDRPPYEVSNLSWSLCL